MLLLMTGKKKKRRSGSADDLEEAPPVVADTMPAPGNNEVVFSLEFDKYEAGVNWRYSTVEGFLEKKRKSGELLVKADMSSWWYDTFIGDPSRFIGEITGMGSNYGFGVYFTLYLLATGGLGAVSMGLAPVGASLGTATMATWAGMIGALGATEVGFSFGTLGKIADVMQDASAEGEIAESQYRPMMEEVGKNFPLWVKYPETGASALEAFAEFAKTHSVSVGPAKEKSLISDLPPTEATSQFFQRIMVLIHRYQQLAFEE